MVALRVAAAGCVLAVAITLAWFTSPWPRVWVIRHCFDRGGIATRRVVAFLQAQTATR